MPKQKNPKLKIKSKLVFYSIIALFIIILVLIFFQFGFADRVKTYFKNPTLYTLKGECYLIANNLIYELNQESDCRMKCINHCWVVRSEFVNSSFLIQQNTCNSCDCYCK